MFHFRLRQRQDFLRFIGDFVLLAENLSEGSEHEQKIERMEILLETVDIERAAFANEKDNDRLQIVQSNFESPESLSRQSPIKLT